MSATIQIRVRGPIPGHEIDDVVDVPVDGRGVPLDLHWRRRLKDAETDNCCERVQAAPKPRRRRRQTTEAEASEE